MKFCNKCQQWLPLTSFHHDSSKWDGLRHICKDCLKSYNNQYYVKNKYDYYIREENRRALQQKAEGKITYTLIQDKLQQYNYSCMYCGADIKETGYHIEHIQPLSRGGSNLPDNIGISCPRCNHQKNNKTFDEYIKWLAHAGYS